jgi:Family of unknown function (DUF5677)
MHHIVAEATLALLDAGFSDEAFGMTRTLVDIFITLHYIANKDTDERARRYAEFSAKDSEVWTEVTKIYWPQSVRPLGERFKRIAATYRSPHQWSGQTVKDMALEADTVEVDPATGKAAVHDFAYRVIYRWTSHFGVAVPKPDPTSKQESCGRPDRTSAAWMVWRSPRAFLSTTTPGNPRKTPTPTSPSEGSQGGAREAAIALVPAM